MKKIEHKKQSSSDDGVNNKYPYQRLSFWELFCRNTRMKKMNFQTKPNNVVSQHIRMHLDESGESLSTFAEKAKLSKSTISRILSTSKKHEINVRTLKKLANAIGLPPDAFILPDGLISFESSFHKASFIDNPFGEGREVYNKALNRAIGKSSIYICDTIPEFLKLPEVLSVELGDQVDALCYGDFMDVIFGSIKSQPLFSGVVLMDKYTLMDLVNGTRIYEGLEPSILSKQVQNIKHFFDLTFPTVMGYAVDFRRSGISTSFTVDDGYGVQFAFGGYIEWQNSVLNNVIRENVKLAIKDAVPVNAFF